MKIGKIDTPEQFYDLIPKSIEENIDFRKRLHSSLIGDKSAQKTYLELCYNYPPIFFSSALFTFDPRQKAGYRNIPFILRPEQANAVLNLKDAIDNGYDLLIEKTRDEGATEIITKLFLMYWLIVPDTVFLVGSRKEEYVDKEGDHKCLFAKIMYGKKSLPLWMHPRKIDRAKLKYRNLDNNSIIIGESTNENFGAGNRSLAIMLDEFGRVEHKVAQSIRDSVSDVTDCVIYNSTHWFGRGHPFAKLRFSNKIKVIQLPWFKNPVKNKGMYRSPDLNIIKIEDIDYYKQKYPKIFSDKQIYKYGELEQDLLFNYPEEKVLFKADGVDKLRSPWYDEQDARRDRRDMASNIDMNPGGAQDSFFDADVCTIIRSEKVRKPDYTGEIEFKSGDKNKLFNIRFRQFGGRERFRWWGELYKGRPNQDHNYIVACDVSGGTGASNSVAGIYDVNTYEKVGIWADPNTPPESFADQVIAICRWIGGRTKKPFLIWEANGPGGSFYKRVRFHGYNFVYMSRNTRDRTNKRTKKPGWYSRGESKYDLLLDLKIALNEGLKTNPYHRALVIYDEDTVGEYDDYMFYENGDIGLSESVDETSGAKKAHGDRVISDGLAVLAMAEVPKAMANEITKVALESNTMAYRRLLFLREQKRRKDEAPWLM